MLPLMPIFTGTAGWTVPKPQLALFPGLDGGKKLSHLERYSRRLSCVEINSSFCRPHRRATWERWVSATPEHFRFAVKAPKAVTHTAKLVNTGAALLEFFEGVHGLGNKLGPVLIQLPPKLDFDEGIAREFFTTLRELHPGGAVVEPRNASWFSASADRLLASFEIARAAADPPRGSDKAAEPGGWRGLCYWRLHGSPRTYYSDYYEQWLQTFAERLELTGNSPPGKETWVIFDNTALGHATANALWLNDALER